MFLPTTLTSLPPGVMLLNCSTAPRDSATNIEKTSQKGTLEQERPNRSVVKMGLSQKDQTKHNTLLRLGTQSVKSETLFAHVQKIEGFIKW